MTAAPDSLVVTGPEFVQLDVGEVLITPTGGTQARLQNIVNGGTAPQSIPALSTIGANATIGSNASIGNPIITGIMRQSIGNAITASATQTLAGATQLNNALNIINTVTTAGDAVKLLAASSATLGRTVVVMNNGASACAIFPGETATAIDAAGAGASVTMTNGRSANFIQNTNSTWVSQGSVGHST